MLKISSNPKIIISIEADFTHATKLGITCTNCTDLNKRLFLMLQLQKAIKSDLNKTQMFLLEQNQESLF